MWIPREIDRIAERLKNGGYAKKLTVRDLLQMFGAERRGLNKVHDIRMALDQVDLVTEPAFESAWIDSVIKLRLKDGYSVLANPGPVGLGMSAEASVLRGDDVSRHEIPEAVESQQATETLQPEIDVAAEGAIRSCYNVVV